jgi:hypothetical protein
MFNYSVIGIKEPAGVFHTARLPHKAENGQILTYEKSGMTYRVFGCREGQSGSLVNCV